MTTSPFTRCYLGEPLGIRSQISQASAQSVTEALGDESRSTASCTPCSGNVRARSRWMCRCRITLHNGKRMSYSWYDTQVICNDGTWFDWEDAVELAKLRAWHLWRTEYQLRSLKQAKEHPDMPPPLQAWLTKNWAAYSHTSCCKTLPRRGSH
jgi:hypothetical protein